MEQPESKAQEQERRRAGERRAGRDLDAVAGQAIDRALALAPEVVDPGTTSAADAERVIEVELASLAEAKFVRKRINAALTVAEWLPEVAVWVWQADVHKRDPLSAAGRERGFEIRMERAPNRS